MDKREERGLIIAAMTKLNGANGTWFVPSQSGEKTYTADPVAKTCICPGHQEWGHKCKHLYAVEITIRREIGKDGTVTETASITFTEQAKGFKIGEMSADKAYLSAENVEAIFGVGGTPFIAPKTNTTGGIGGLFAKMFHYFQYRREEFMDHYHERSNVESLFSAVKRKFGDSVRSKGTPP